MIVSKNVQIIVYLFDWAALMGWSICSSASYRVEFSRICAVPTNLAIRYLCVCFLFLSHSACVCRDLSPPSLLHILHVQMRLIEQDQWFISSIWQMKKSAVQRRRANWDEKEKIADSKCIMHKLPLLSLMNYDWIR